MPKSTGKSDRNKSSELTVATFNVNGINGRIATFVRWLGQREPDIVCLQELKAPQAKFPVAALEAAGYHSVWKGQSRWNGVAILSRGSTPIVTRSGLPGDAADEQSRYLEAAVKGILICCLYLPNGNPTPGPKFEYKMGWIKRLEAHAEQLIRTGAPVILAGDFNIIPTASDVYKPERWTDDALFKPEVRAAFARLQNDGWLDALRACHPNARIYTFWDYFRNAWGRNAGLRLDHQLLSPSIQPRLIDAGVDREVRGWEKASDHAPMWLKLREGA